MYDLYDFQFSDAGLTTWMLLRQSSSLVQNAAARKLAKVGLSPEQTDVLRIASCKNRSGPLTPAEISRLVSRETQTVAGLLNRMEREGLVTRIPKKKGRPFTEVTITAKGKEAYGPAIDVAKDIITRIMSTLSEEEHEQLQKLLRVLLQKAAEELHLELSLLLGYSVGEAIPVEW